MAEETEFEKLMRETDEILARTDEHIADTRAFMRESVEESEKMNRMAEQALRYFGRVSQRASLDHARELDDIDKFLRDADRELAQKESEWAREDEAGRAATPQRRK